MHEWKHCSNVNDAVRRVVPGPERQNLSGPQYLHLQDQAVRRFGDNEEWSSGQNSPALLTTVTALRISSPDHYIVRRSFCKETPEGLQKVLGSIETERSKARLSLFASCDLACVLHSSYDLASLIFHASYVLIFSCAQ